MALKNSTNNLVEKMDNLLKSYDNTIFPSFDVVLRDNFSHEEISRLIEFYSYCDCCERHQVDKPEVFEKYKFKKAKYEKRMNKDCRCYCRHINRTMCAFIKDHR